MQPKKCTWLLLCIGVTLLMSFPAASAAPTNPNSPKVLTGNGNNTDTWQPGDINAYYKLNKPDSGCLLAYNGSDSLKQIVLSKNSDFSSPILNKTFSSCDSYSQAWVALWNPDSTNSIYVNLTRDYCSPQNKSYQIQTRYPTEISVNQTQAYPNVQVAHRQCDIQGSFFDNTSFVSFFYKVQLTAGHYYSIKLGNKNWETLPSTYGGFNLALIIISSPQDSSSALFYPYNSYTYLYAGMALGVFPVYFGVTDFHPQSTQTYYIVGLTASGANSWKPARFQIQDEANSWTDYVASNPLIYLSPDVNPFLFIAVVGGVSFVVVYAIVRSMRKSKVKKSVYGGTSVKDFLDEL